MPMAKQRYATGKDSAGRKRPHSGPAISIVITTISRDAALFQIANRYTPQSRTKNQYPTISTNGKVTEFKKAYGENVPADQSNQNRVYSPVSGYQAVIFAAAGSVRDAAGINPAAILVNDFRFIVSLKEW